MSMLGKKTFKTNTFLVQNAKILKVMLSTKKVVFSGKKLSM
jgi:hypothetical protein